MPERLPRKILHIDDDFMLRALIEAIFKDAGGIDCRSAENGSQALEVLEEFTPGLILLDLSMPELDGGQFLQTIRKKDDLKATPVVIITQFSNISASGRNEKLGIIGMMAKPIDPLNFINDLLEIWGEYRKAA